MALDPKSNEVFRQDTIRRIIVSSVRRTPAIIGIRDGSPMIDSATVSPIISHQANEQLPKNTPEDERIFLPVNP